MPRFIRFFFFLLVLSTIVTSVGAQNFDYLPAVRVTKPMPDSSFSFVMNTMTNSYESINVEKPWVNSVQIVDADQPWPPRWYAATPIYTHDEFVKDAAKEQYRFHFITDAKTEAGYFSFFKLVSLTNDDGYLHTDVQGYIMLNKKMEPVDTVGTSTEHINPYWHDFRINSKGERLIDVKVNQLLDLRKATGNPADKAIPSTVDEIQVLDSNNKILFKWVSTDKLDPGLFQFNESLHTKKFARNGNDNMLVNWSHLTSAIWDYDGNILYSLRFIGVGKINRQTGELMWHINFNDLPIVSGKDTIDWKFPHDFKLLSQNDTAAFYSIYSLGDTTYPRARAVMYEQNKKTNKLKLVNNFYPAKNYMGVGQGSFDYQSNSEYTFCFGFYDYGTADTGYWADAFEYHKDNSATYTYQLPRNIQSYRVLKLTDWPRPPRPVIELKDGMLQVSGNQKELTWYELNGPALTNAVKAGTGKKLQPRKGATYCVQAPYGMGYVVSKAFTNK